PKLPPVASLITKAVKPIGKDANGKKNVGGVIGTFAASGEGIQLRYGAHAGRLIQQYIGKVIQDDGSEESQAYSVYSDDGGDSWKMGTPVGSGMDENKVVELSNGNVMLNSRPQAAGFRRVAISTDGGVTYSEPEEDAQLPDPANNGAIVRAYPDAAQGSAEAKILLFTNTATKDSRTKGTIRYSCDDGEKWSSGKVYKAGKTAYSTVTALGDDLFGLFYEDEETGSLTFAKVDKEWIGVSC
ncbi:exo-alpha-sialidase, partial [Candidatus Bathyarchaeota archaeon]|nr:exo-alpha-sialidase [Candidatus Bathyarchaeota archaeon]